MNCKILKCRAPIYRVSLCRAHYREWVEAGELPGPIKPGRTLRPEDETYIKRSHHNRIMRAANAVADHAGKWAAEDDTLAAAIAAYEKAKAYDTKTEQAD